MHDSKQTGMLFDGSPCEGRGYWISPAGTVIPVALNHITTICLRPSQFDRNEDALRSIFERYGEPWCFEGQAREQIIREVIYEGWIRVRHYPRRPRRWTFNLSDLTPASLARVRAFCNRLSGSGTACEAVILDSQKGQHITTVGALCADE
jgi:hypothetical protein